VNPDAFNALLSIAVGAFYAQPVQPTTCSSDKRIASHAVERRTIECLTPDEHEAFVLALNAAFRDLDHV
jgi:hypothetical protein